LVNVATLLWNSSLPKINICGHAGLKLAIGILHGEFDAR